MPGLIYEKYYTASADKLRKRFPWADEAIEAIEWELLRATDMSRYPLIRNGPPEVRYLKTRPARGHPGLVAVFSLEQIGGEKKAVLRELFEADPDKE